MPLTSPEDVNAAELLLENDAIANNPVMVNIHIVLHQLIFRGERNNNYDNIGNALRITMMPNEWHRAFPPCCVTVSRQPVIRVVFTW